MILEQAKQKVLELIQLYFGGARVIWAENNLVKPILPLVRLKMLAVTEEQFPATFWEEEQIKSYYAAKSVWEVVLHTPGELLSSVLSQTTAANNTALNDLVDLGDFLNSPFVGDWATQNNLTISWSGKVEDVSITLNELRWEYRARATFEVDFIREAIGNAGIIRSYGWHQTASGGGIPALVESASGYFTEAEIREEEEV